MESRKIVLTAGAVCVAFAAAGYLYLHVKARQPFLRHGAVNPHTKQSYGVGVKSFTVAPGDSAGLIARKLRQAGLISNSLFFTLYIKQEGIADELKAGTYELSAAMSPKEMADKMARGDVFRDVVKITIPEGFTLAQIEERAGKPLSQFTVGELRSDFDFLLDAPAGASLEGYLFPDTYEFERTASARDVVEMMLNNFGKKWSALARANQRTVHETVTMASLIQEEVITEADMKLVSGVLWRRIALGMPLQVDATVSYAVGKQELTYDDLKADSPYNTYLYKDLPKGPIANPGLQALQAAVFPTESEYLYYLSKPDRETVFSKTLVEHNRAKALYLK